MNVGSGLLCMDSAFQRTSFVLSLAAGQHNRTLPNLYIHTHLFIKWLNYFAIEKYYDLTSNLGRL